MSFIRKREREREFLGGKRFSRKCCTIWTFLVIILVSKPVRTTATFNISFGIGRKTVEDCNSSLKASIAGLTKPLTEILEERYSCWKTKDDLRLLDYYFSLYQLNQTFLSINFIIFFVLLIWSVKTFVWSTAWSNQNIFRVTNREWGALFDSDSRWVRTSEMYQKMEFVNSFKVSRQIFENDEQKVL